MQHLATTSLVVENLIDYSNQKESSKTKIKVGNNKDERGYNKGNHKEECQRLGL